MFLDKLLEVGSRAFGSGFEDLIEVESKDSEYALSCKDGSLMSILRVRGSLVLSGEAEFNRASSKICDSLRSSLSSGEHSLQIVFSSNPDNLKDDLQDSFYPSMVTAKKLGMDISDLVDDDIETLSKFCTSEEVYLVLYTSPQKLTKQEIKQENAARTELYKAHPQPLAEDAPAFFRVISSLRIRHDSFVELLVNDFKAVDILVDRLDAHQAVRVMKQSVCNEFTSREWKPILLGDPIPLRVLQEGAKDYSGCLWPSVGEQILHSDTEEVSNNIIKVGNRYYWPMHIYLHQQDILPFKKLLNTVGVKMPWRMSFLIESKGLSFLAIKDIMALFFAFTSPRHNGNYTKARDRVEEAVRDWGDQDVRYRVDFVTWGADINECNRHAEFLSRCVQGWGVTEVKSLSGDPTRAYTATCVGLNKLSLATPSVANLSDVITHLPVHRPASPWLKGNMIYRSRDGKLFTHQPMSTLVTSSITCMLAEPRYGKTLLANALNWALCIAPGNDVLPLISIVDVGRGSSGLISLLKFKLPRENRHLASYIKMLNDDEHRINPFDNQLRCRYPIGTDRDFLANILLTLLTPEGAAGPAEGMDGIVNLAIDTIYEELSDSARPKAYVQGRCKEVDEALTRIDFFAALRVKKGLPDPSMKLDVSWWEVVDALFDEKLYHEAALAQRYAVPTIQDIVPLVNNNAQFEDLYGETKVGSEPILRVYSRLLSEAIRKYPIIGGPTVWDIGTARVLSINVEQAIDKQRSGGQQNALMYMLALFVTTRNFLLNEDLIPSYDMECRDYHKARIMQFRQCKKLIQVDEYHRAKGIAPLENMIQIFLREGGKWDIGTTLISHLAKDFPDGFLSWVTSMYVLSPQSEEAAVSIARELKVIDKAPSIVDAMMSQIQLPGKAGSTFVGIFRTKHGESAHLLNGTFGSTKLWSFSTSSEDGYVRDRLYERIGDAATARILKRLYPAGSLKPEYEERKTMIENSGLDVDDAAGLSILDKMVEEIYQTFVELRANGKM